MPVRFLTPFLLAGGLIAQAPLSGAQQQPLPPQQKPDPTISPGERMPAPPDAQAKPQVPSPVSLPQGAHRRSWRMHMRPPTRRCRRRRR